MLFLDRLELDRRLRLLRRELGFKGVSEELRGWSFDSPPVEPPSRSVLFSVSELAGRYCSSMRDIYLRRVLGVKAPASVKTARGVVLHNLNRELLLSIKRLLFSGDAHCGFELVEAVSPLMVGLVEKALLYADYMLSGVGEDVKAQLRDEALAFCRFLAVQAAARLDQALSKHPNSDVDSLVSIAVPPIAERKVDGSLVGLSKELSVDVYTPFNAVADLKTGEEREFHPYALAGYALALEADEGVPVDYGFVVYVRFPGPVPSFKVKCFVIGDELRREFIEIRDEAYELVSASRDPGKPPNCPIYCPYHPVCRGGSVEETRDKRAGNIPVR